MRTLDMFTSPCARVNTRVYVCGMKIWISLLCLLFACSGAKAASKPHVIVFGKWATVKWHPEGDDDAQIAELKTRTLFVDGRAKEYTAGLAHQVTERLFVVQRVFRLNDSLPQESGPVRWRWQLGGWLAVDRSTGKVQALNLPEFEPGSSLVTWFRDYGAYCGTAEDGKKAFAIIVQLGKRKPVLKKPLDGDSPACEAPQWQRDPVRAIFELRGGEKLTYLVKSRSVDLAAEAEDNNPEE